MDLMYSTGWSTLKVWLVDQHGVFPMPQALKAIYRNGAFILQTAFELPEGTEVELLVQSPQIVSPPISDVETKRQFLKSLTEKMQRNPIPFDAPQFTREMLHERR
ncbi:MAG: antitoxin family protein [Leptolyngbya sp. Prado105]|nr:antitoxin family protein [Leptolyngbya sp. Prado105]